MAVERACRVEGSSAQGESLVQIISILGARRRELKAAAGERLLLLEARDAVAEARLVELETRLATVEDRLEVLGRARAAASRRTELRRAGIAQLKQQVQILRARASVADVPAGMSTRTSAARLHHLGSALMYVGGLLVLWVVLLELGLALGLS